MDLEEFIASTLAEIARGVTRAQETTVGEYGPWVSPIGTRMPPLAGMVLLPLGNGEHGYLQNVAFDVAVTASDKIEGKAEAGVQVVGIVGATGGGAVENRNTSASRVQFHIPLVLPGMRVLPREARLNEDRQRESEAVTAQPRRGRRYTSRV